jgi:hypothetical protein
LVRFITGDWLHIVFGRLSKGFIEYEKAALAEIDLLKMI